MSRPLRVLLLSQFFDPEPTLKGLAFARGLRDRGCEVEVLTGFPNYPGGVVYPGYRRRPWTRETIDGIRVNRVWLYPSHDRSAVRRVLNYGSFATAATLIGPAMVRKPDVIYVHHPPPTIALAARTLRRIFGAPFVYEVQDLWPDTLAATNMLSNPRVLRGIGRVCDAIYRDADRVVAISPGFERRLVARGVDESRIEVVYNWCDEERLVPAPRDPALARELGLDSRFTVMFAGTMGLAQHLDTVLDAAERCATLVPQARFAFVGGGVDRERLARAAVDRRLGNVRFIARQPMERMGSILALADALLVHLRDDPLFQVTVPSKTQAYLYMGVPIVMAVRGDGADLVRRSGGGITCEPERSDQMAAAIATLSRFTPEARRAMGASGRAFYEIHLSLATGVQRYATMLGDLAAGRLKPT